MKNENGVIMQYFEWYIGSEKHLWNILKKEALYLSKIGITAIWTPPAYKGAAGKQDVGYGTYDLYDLGEFDQKGSIETKYGTKQEYLEMIHALHKVDIQVYGDIVLDHKMGADETQQIKAVSVNAQNREEVTSEEQLIEAWTKFTFPNRNDKYSSFHWGWEDFDGIDYDQKTKQNRIFRFYGKDWDSQVDDENCNYDYLMGADIDFTQPRVVEELTTWGKWYLDITDIDGVRIDAVKHIQFTFYKKWLDALRSYTKKEVFAVGEYWSSDVKDLIHYLETDQYVMSLFDVPLHYHFYEASCSNGNYDMSKLFDHTLVAYDECKAVTFVDNHDTQPGQALPSFVLDWFKPSAYAIILLRKQGYPCVFYGDYYGIPHDSIPAKQDILNTLLHMRQNYAFGEQHDYFDDFSVVGFTREGNQEHPQGLAVILTDRIAGEKRMYVGKQHAACIFHDVLGHYEKDIIIDEEGFGLFHVLDGSLSVYAKK